MKYLMILPIVLAAVCGAVSQANASPYQAQHVQTIHHCGYVQTQGRNIANHPRNIAILQEKLEQAGYDVGTTGIDGIYGYRTKRAVRNFQNDYNLPINAKLDGDTIALVAYATHPSANVRRCKSPAQL